MRALTSFQAKVLADVAGHEPTSCAEVAQRLGQRNLGQTRIALKALARSALVARSLIRTREGDCEGPPLYRLTRKGAHWTEPRHTSMDSWLDEGVTAGWISSVDAVLIQDRYTTRKD